MTIHLFDRPPAGSTDIADRDLDRATCDLAAIRSHRPDRPRVPSTTGRRTRWWLPGRPSAGGGDLGNANCQFC